MVPAYSYDNGAEQVWHWMQFVASEVRQVRHKGMGWMAWAERVNRLRHRRIKGR